MVLGPGYFCVERHIFFPPHKNMPVDRLVTITTRCVSRAYSQFTPGVPGMDSGTSVTRSRIQLLLKIIGKMKMKVFNYNMTCLCLLLK